MVQTITRLEGVDKPGDPHVADKLAPIVTPARYAKGMMVVQCPSDGSGWKTRAARIASALPGRWSNRSKGYVMTPKNAQRVLDLYAAEQDAELGDVRGKLGFTLTKQDNDQ